MSFLDEIEPLKQTALANSRPRPTSPRWNKPRARGSGRNGKFTALMKQLGTLPKEEKPAAGKLINAAKVELEAALAARRAELELKAALPKEPTDFTLPGRRRALGKLHPLTQVTDDIVRSFPQNWLCRRRRPGNRGRISLLRRPEHARRPSRARFAGHVLS